MDEGSPCFRIVIDHLLVECGAPCRLVRPFGIADEAAVAIAVQARAIAPIAFPDQIRPAPPGGAKLLFLAGRSDEHTSELQSLMRISYAVFCLKKKKHKLSNLN